MTNQPMGDASYTPPQDPWAGTQGVAVTPTDPIPQPPAPAYGQFAPGVATPSWSAHDTIAHPGADGYVEPRRRGGLGRYLVVILMVLLLGGGGGYAAWYLITNRYQGNLDLGIGGRGNPSPSSSASPSPTVSRPPQAVPGDLRVGDCMKNIHDALKLPSTAGPYMVRADCGDHDAYKVLKIVQNVDKPPVQDEPSMTNLFRQVCTGVAGANAYYHWGFDTDPKFAYFMCLHTDSPAT